MIGCGRYSCCRRRKLLWRGIQTSNCKCPGPTSSRRFSDLDTLVLAIGDVIIRCGAYKLLRRKPIDLGGQCNSLHRINMMHIELQRIEQEAGNHFKLWDEERSNFVDCPDVEHSNQYTSPLSPSPPSTTCAREKREIKVDSAKVSRKTDE